MPDNDPYVPALGFHFLTPAYDAVVRVTTRERAFKSTLVAEAKIQPGHRVLDLACGTGTLAILLSQSCPRAKVIGIDGDERMLAIARRKSRASGPELQFDRGLSYALPYADASFDLATSSLFFHHLSWGDKQRTVAELYRVLRPGGQLLVADWGRASGPLMRAAFLLVQLLDGLENTQDNVNGALEELFSDSGFVGVRQSHTFTTALGTMSLYQMTR